MNIKTFGVLFAQLATTAAIDIGAKDAADKYARAQVALQVASSLQSLSTGDVTGALAQAQAALLSKVTDPGQAVLVTTLFATGDTFIQAASVANGLLPLVNATWQGAAAEAATGITNVASAYKAA
ncbi:MAG: hypothetical protein KGL39_15365 [Patescibacteria group bacterium]|nr:hypothetical protein [Patescibacteria group bacterium]